MKYKTTNIILAGALLFSAGCASIVTKTSYPVHINSTPLGAKISIENSSGTKVYEGLTPVVVDLKPSEGFFKKAAYTVKFKKDGYEDVEVQIRCKLNGWYYGNILLGVVPGMLIVDPATGAMYKIEDDYIMEALTPLPNHSSRTTTFGIYALDEIPDSLKDNLTLIGN